MLLFKPTFEYFDLFNIFKQMFFSSDMFIYICVCVYVCWKSV